MKDTTFIYTLSCPDSGLVRYVGKSDNPEKRFQRHTESNGETSHKVSWIKGLKNNNKLPVMRVIDEVPWCDWKEWEKSYIKMFKACGANLVNSTDGGDGGLSLAARKKLSEKNKGRRFSSDEQNAKNIERLVNYSKTHSPWNKGKSGYKSTISDESRIKRNELSKGKHGGKPILQYDLEGNFIREWRSGYDLKEIGLRLCDILKAIDKPGYHARGFTWKRKKY